MTTVERSAEGVYAHPKYRPDIDGLRAVAVVAVILFHFGSWWAEGGYVGVDIFFVISGYLISTIIQRELDLGRFSISRFYVRRICRILPAYLAMALFTWIAAYGLFYPVDFRQFAQSFLAASFSVSNIYFWATSGYFAPEASHQLLLHTWSLAVEEQFYLFLPLLLIALHKKGRHHRNVWVCSILLVSLGGSAYLVFSDPNSTFYLLPTRAWELLAGTALALIQFPRPRTRWAIEAVSAAGVVLMGVAMLTFKASTPFPGLAALLPCGGTFLLLLSGESGAGFFYQLLSSSPARFIGRISYSLYLWHWPIIVLQKQYAVLGPNEWAFPAGRPHLVRNAIMAAVIVALAWTSWKFIEQPFRNLQTAFSPRRIFLSAAGATCTLALFGVFTTVTKGLESRFGQEEVRLAAYLNYGEEHFRPGQCFILSPYRAAHFDRASCLKGLGSSNSILIMGDSTAAGLWHGLSQRLSGWQISQATGAGCKPLLKQSRAVNKECAAVIDEAFRAVNAASGRETTLLLSARWQQEDLGPLKETIRWLQSQRLHVVVLGPPVEYKDDLPRLLAQAVRKGNPGNVEDQLVPRPPVDSMLLGLTSDLAVRYASPYELLCEKGRPCPALLSGGVPFVFDRLHYTKEGSQLVARRLDESRLFGQDFPGQPTGNSR